MNKFYKSFFWAMVSTIIFTSFVYGVALIITLNLWGIAFVAISAVVGITLFLYREE